jgi:hypothetical protein
LIRSPQAHGAEREVGQTGQQVSDAPGALDGVVARVGVGGRAATLVSVLSVRAFTQRARGPSTG